MFRYKFLDAEVLKLRKLLRLLTSCPCSAEFTFSKMTEIMSKYIEHMYINFE